MEKKLKCTLSFTDAHLIDAEDLVQNPEEQSLTFDEMIISHLKKKYYPSLNIDIDITNHEGEFVDFDACVSFECAGLRQYVDSVKALIWCQLA